MPTECSVDVTPDNVVVVLLKAEGGGAEWSSFTVGPTAAGASVSGQLRMVTEWVYVVSPCV